MTRIDRIGQTFAFTDGTTMTIIEYNRNDDISVMFDDGTIQKNVKYCSFAQGLIKNKNKPFVCGIGFMGYGEYSMKTDKKCNQVWRGMIQRCYDNGTKERQQTYIGCSVHPDWHNFQNFAKWFYNNYKNGFQLDKDILVKDNKIYGPNTCCFVPTEINLLLIYPNKVKGVYPFGVTKLKNKFTAKMSVNGIQEYLGSYDCPNEAFYVYKEAKEKRVKEMAMKYKDQITTLCYESLMNWSININD